MNIIHYMHDKYAYEKTQMALHDTDVHRYMPLALLVYLSWQIPYQP